MAASYVFVPTRFHINAALLDWAKYILADSAVQQILSLLLDVQKLRRLSAEEAL